MDPTSQDMADLASNLGALTSKLASVSDPADKKNLQNELVMAAKKVVWQCQDPVDALLDHVVNAYTIGAISALLEVGVFDAIPPVGTIAVEDLAAKCGAEEQLIIRLMRQVTCVNIFNEVKVHQWSHNRLSIGLSAHAGDMGKTVWTVAMDELYPSMHSLNQYIRQFGKTDVRTYTDAPYSWEENALGKNFWEILSSYPDRLDTFNRCLSMFSAKNPIVAIFPFEQILAPGNSPSRPLAVDIGGGLGHALLELREKCPSLHGELILQDRAVVLDDIPPASLPGVTKMAHDFFTEQPVRNAQMYYIRRVMHDWLDDDAARILASVRPAMGPDSRVLVSDMVLPTPVTPRDAHAVWYDLMMMTIGGKERAEADWVKLADMAGLKLVKIWQEPEKYGPLCVVEYMLPDAVNGTQD